MAYQFDFKDLQTSGYIDNIATMSDEDKNAAFYTCLFNNLVSNLGLPSDISVDEWKKLLQSNAEAKEFYKEFKINYAFYMEMGRGNVELNLTDHELRDLHKSRAIFSKAFRKYSTEMTAISEKYRRDKEEKANNFFKEIEGSSPFGLLKYITSQNIDIKTSFELQRQYTGIQLTKAIDEEVLKMRLQLIDDIRSGKKIDWRAYLL